MDRRRGRGERMRSLTRAAYTAAAGHLEIEPEPETRRGRPRWAPTVRAAVTAAAVVLAAGLVLAAWAWLNRPGDPVPLPERPDAVETAVASPTADAAPTGTVGEREPPAASVPTVTMGAVVPVVVHVAGAVTRPGVVELPAGARVAEAVEAAGGATTEAELSAVNLARLLVDGEQVFVPAVGEAEPGAQSGSPPGVRAPDAAPSGPAGDGAAGGGPVDLNTATADQLDALPGIGPALAARILDWRDTNGSFTSVEDLDEVSGIGPATMDRLRDLVTV